jgi:hypothetical protein
MKFFFTTLLVRVANVSLSKDKWQNAESSTKDADSHVAKSGEEWAMEKERKLSYDRFRISI